MAHGRLCERLYVEKSTLDSPPVGVVTRIIDARGFNAVRFGVTVLQTDAELRVTVQASDDMENWTDVVTLGSTFVLGFSFPAAATAIQASYVRLSLIMIVGEPGPTATVAVTYNLTNL